MKASGPRELGIVMRPGHLIRRPAKPPSKTDAQQSEKLMPSDSPGDSQTKATSTKIFIKGLMVEAECGVYAHEKGRRRPLVVDIEVSVGLGVRAGQDELSETLDYDILASHVREVAGAAHLHLIETFAEQVCARVLTDARVNSVRMRVEKPGAVPGAACSGVEMERTR
jgi:dihydroneopterin aldolase